MKIISNFKDYYDYMSYLGIDNSVVYERMTRKYRASEFKSFDPYSLDFYDIVGSYRGFKSIEFNSTIRYNGKLYSIHLVHRTIVFCGTCYTFWEYEKKDSRFKPKDIEIIWSIDRLREVVYSIFDMQKRNKYRYEYYIQDIFWNSLKKWQIQPAREKFIRNNEYPVVYLYGNEKITNPRLSDLKFYNVVFPQEAWQRISMWLTRPKDVPETSRSEKTDLIRHGMDKTSFKRNNHPGKPRKRKNGKNG